MAPVLNFISSWRRENTDGSAASDLPETSATNAAAAPSTGNAGEAPQPPPAPTSTANPEDQTTASSTPATPSSPSTSDGGDNQLPASETPVQAHIPSSEANPGPASSTPATSASSSSEVPSASPVPSPSPSASPQVLAPVESSASSSAAPPPAPPVQTSQVPSPVPVTQTSSAVPQQSSSPGSGSGNNNNGDGNSPTPVPSTSVSVPTSTPTSVIAVPVTGGGGVGNGNGGAQPQSSSTQVSVGQPTSSAIVPVSSQSQVDPSPSAGSGTANASVSNGATPTGSAVTASATPSGAVGGVDSPLVNNAGNGNAVSSGNSNDNSNNNDSGAKQGQGDPLPARIETENGETQDTTPVVTTISSSTLIPITTTAADGSPTVISSLVPTLITTTLNVPKSSGLSSAPGPGSPHSNGPIIGGILGGLVFLSAAIGLGFFLFMRRRRRPQSDSHVSSFPTDFVTPDPFRYVASQEPSFLQTAVAGDAERARKASYGGFGLGMRGASGEGAGGFHSRNGSTMSSVSLGMGMSESGNTRPSVLPRKPAPKLLDHMDVGSGLGLGYGATMTRPTSQLSQVSHFTGFSMVNPYSFPNAGDANENDIADADVRGLGQTQTRQNHPSNPFADQNPFEDPAVRKRDSYGGLGVGQSPHGRRRSLQVGPDAVARLSGVSASSSNFKWGEAV